MGRIKIDYGIDLGTTNSALARMENGEPVIKKSDSLKDTMPSCIGFNRKGSLLGGDTARKSLHQEKIRSMKSWSEEESNFFIEFKRTMGTAKKYHSSHMESEFNSEQLSSEVLKKLRSFVTDENFQSVIVTVPAQFDIPQKDSTKRAANLAGFTHCELLQEPVAASMAYGLANRNKNGFWVVFDFGGGTFDAALVKVEDGIMKVVATDGDNYLGGKNLDDAIVDEIIIPYFQQKYSIDSILGNEKKKRILQEAMKMYAEEAKIELSFKDESDIITDLGELGEDDNGEEFVLDITITRDDLRKVLGHIFQRAIDITKELLQRNNLTGSKLDSLILVGGPTYSPILREMLEEQIKKPDTSVDPMTAVAVGAALYASTIDLSEEVRESTRDKNKIQLDVGFSSTTVELEDWVTLKTVPEKTEGEIPNPVFAEITRGDKAWSSGKVKINDKGEIVEVKLREHKPNNFEISLYDQSGNRLESQPEAFTIFQGIGGTDSAASLPHNIGIELKRRSDGRLIFSTIDGLLKNQSVPATGTKNKLKTQRQVRPGMTLDVIKIPIYQGDDDAEGSRAIYNKIIYPLIITGDDLPALLPENSDVDLTFVTDRSGRIATVKAFFPLLEHTVNLPIPEESGTEIESAFLERELANGETLLHELNVNGHSNQTEIDKLKEELSYLRTRLDQGASDYDRKLEVHGGLIKSLRKVDALDEKTKWPRLESELREEFERLDQANNDLGNEKTTQHVNQLRSQVDEVIRKKDVKVGQALLEEVHDLFFALTFVYQLIGFVRHHDEDFDSYNWKDPQHARHLIQRAQQIISENPTRESLHPVVLGLIDLLPMDERPGDDLEVLMG